MRALGIAALRYAGAGLAVLPLHTPQAAGCSCRAGTGCPSAGKHPRLRHGLREASTDPRLIRAWWRRWPEANIGVATGTLIDVCDADTSAGLAAVLNLLDVIRPAGPIVRTGSGWHLWFAPTGLGNRVAVLPGMDWRGRGGAVVAPPSLHATGRRYLFTQPWAPGQAFPACPPALRGLLARPTGLTTATTGAGLSAVADLDRYVQAALDGEISRVLAAPRPVFQGGHRLAPGGRNNALHLAAFRLGQLSARGSLDAGVAWPRLAQAAGAVGLSGQEARSTIASGWRAGLRRPRR